MMVRFASYCVEYIHTYVSGPQYNIIGNAVQKFLQSRCAFDVCHPFRCFCDVN